MGEHISYQTTEQYAFTDRTERSSTTYEDVNDYDCDSELGRDIEVTILVKWNDQRERDDGIRELALEGARVGRSNTLPPSPRRRLGYFGGFVLRATLEQDALLPHTVEAQPATRPTGVSMKKDGQTAYACGNKLLLSPDGDVDAVSATIEHPLFARLHSAAFSDDGERILTASASLDMLYEVRVADGAVEWSMDIWSETPYNQNALGQSFYRVPRQGSTDYLLNPTPSELEDNEHLRNADCVIDDPAAYDGLGLTTALTPVFINGVGYETDDVILATSFGRGEAWRIDREHKEIEVAAKGLGRPHGFHVNIATGGYLVSDTRKERVLFLDKSLEREKVYDLSGMGDRKQGLEGHRWLQYVTELRPGLYCAVMSSRQTLVLFDPASRTRRTIALHPDWGVQTVAVARSH